MNRDEQKEALEAIKLMIGARSNSQSGIGPETVKGYLLAVSDCSLWAIQQATTAFIKGNVLDYDFDYYPPHAPRLAIEARKWDDARQLQIEGTERRRRERIVSYPIGTLPAPPLEPLGPIKIEVDGRIRDVSHLTYAQKMNVLRTGKMPDETPEQIGRAAPTPRLRKV